MSLLRGFLLVVGILDLGISVRAASLQYSTKNSAVRITAISPDVFRISIDTRHHTARPIQSIYLNPALAAHDSGRLAKTPDGDQLLHVAAGTVDFDPYTDTIFLKNSQGSALTLPTELATRTTLNDKPAVAIHFGWPKNHPFTIYGCGNGADSIEQHEIKSRVGNGVAVQPFFFAPAGFAMLVVGSDPDAPAQCDGKIDRNAVTWIVPGTSADVYLIITPSLEDASRTLLRLTGPPPVPPRWTFGYLQSRWGWKDKAYIDDALHQFITRKLPVDAFIFDFEWYTTFPDYDVPPQGDKNYSDFNFNPALFPDPAAQIKQLHDAGIRFVGIRKPRLGNSDTLMMVRSKGGDVVGGNGIDARNLRFDLPALRHWYASRMEPLLRTDIDGWWDDEGEYTYTAYDNWNRAEREALDAVNPHARLWTIDRAFEPGTSRFGAAAWTGDIRASWDSFRQTPTALLNWSISGMPFCSCDIGGHIGETTPQLLTRWMEAGTFFPVMRAHSTLHVTPHFPWLFGADSESAIRKALDLRYQLIPFLYSLAHQTHETGTPIMRPLFMQYPSDPAVANLSDEWLIGQNLLVAPVLTPDNSRKIYLPDDTWYDFATGQRVTGARTFTRQVPFDSVPVFIRAGAILPLGPVIQHTRDLPGGPLDLNIYPGRDGEFTLAEDDGETTAYLNGKLRRTTFTWSDKEKMLRWTRTGYYHGADCFQSIRIILHDGTARQAIERPLSARGDVAIP